MALFKIVVFCNPVMMNYDRVFSLHSSGLASQDSSVGWGMPHRQVVAHAPNKTANPCCLKSLFDAIKVYTWVTTTLHMPA